MRVPDGHVKEKNQFKPKLFFISKQTKKEWTKVQEVEGILQGKGFHIRTRLSRG